MLKQENRLKKRKEFNYIYSNGESSASKYLVLLFTSTPKNPVRVGFSVSKKIGKAYFRNKIKRRLSSILRDLIALMESEYTYIFVAREGAGDISYAELKQNVLYLLNKTQKLKDKV